jgi:hypothetical protein
MSKFERLLAADSTELPDCRCAAEMNLMAIVPVAGGDTEISFSRRHARSDPPRLVGKA